MEPTQRYDFRAIERAWQQRWHDADLFALPPVDDPREKFYYLDMFPYPSGNLHMGHLRNYTIGDVVARYQTMRGRAVLHPMGWDAFGLPAENAAIKHHTHPDPWTRTCIQEMHRQLDMLGISFNWDREVNTSAPDYYHWTQWLFLQFYAAGHVTRSDALVNWCTSCQTVLANEQVMADGTCERCDQEVIKKRLEQWFYKTTDYAQRLLDDLDGLTEWPEQVRTMQRNWIGRSEGVEFAWHVAESDITFRVFTTRVDTVFGVTYMALAPEHPLLETLIADRPEADDVRAFVRHVLAADQFARASADAPKEGVFTGAYATHPLTGAPVPIWVANYVMMDYGTGAIMAVPAHDERDFAFATQYNLPIPAVIVPEGETAESLALPYIGDGFQANSGQFDGLPNQEAMVRIAEWMEGEGLGERTVNFRLRDWCLSRQRYWGCPIPIIYCEQCGTVPVPDDQLPVRLPTDVEFTGHENPLATSPTFQHVDCPRCGAAARRETDTMDTFVDSSWYFLRFASQPPDAAFARAEIDRWLPVDQYVGGIEHATMHLIYARYFTKVLYDLGLIGVTEPFARLFTQGMVTKAAWWAAAEKRWYTEPEQLAADGLHTPGGAPVERQVAKMSKSIGNVVAPEGICEAYGADTGRCYILFIGPPNAEAEWQDDGVVGIHRWLTRVWRLTLPRAASYLPAWREVLASAELDAEQRALRQKLHQTIARLTADIEDFGFNTAIAALMELVNAAAPFAADRLAAGAEADRAVFSELAETLALLLSPFAPHLADEIWAATGHEGSTYQAAWPVSDPALARRERLTIVVQVNGKVRDKLEVDADTPEETIRAAALASERVQSFMDGKTPRKVVYVPGRLVNIVV